jgi:hypothetical protein
MATGLTKFTFWADSVPVAWKEADGFPTFLAMAANAMKEPASLACIQAVSAVGIALVVVALWFSMRELRLVSRSVRGIWRMPAIAVTLFFGFVIFG